MEGGRFDLFELRADLLEGIEDAAGVSELYAVVEDGLQDVGEGVEGLLVGGWGWD
jgi:hypothetical protein